MLELTKNILQIHYFGNKCVVKTDEGLIPLNTQWSYLVSLINENGQMSIEEIVQAFSLKFKINATHEEIKRVIYNSILNSRLAKVLFQETTAAGAPDKIQTSGSVGRFIPYVLNIELTNICNLNCAHCYKSANQHPQVYIQLEKLKELFNFLASKDLSITLTGGEATLHNDFHQIAELCFLYGNINIVTNGINLVTVDSKILNNLNLISISLYGTDDELYRLNTGIKDGFYKLEKSIDYLHSIGKDFILDIVLDREKVINLEKYVQVAERLGAKSFQVGLPAQSGKLNKKSKENAEWNISDLEIRTAYRKIRELKKRGKTSINILDWERDVYETSYSYDNPNNPANFYSPHCMKCGAGTIQWTVSEDFKFRPCNLLTNSLYQPLSYDVFKQFVDGTIHINWEKCMKEYEDIFAANGYKLSRCCKRLTDFLHETLN